MRWPLILSLALTSCRCGSGDRRGVFGHLRAGRPGALVPLLQTEPQTGQALGSAFQAAATVQVGQGAVRGPRGKAGGDGSILGWRKAGTMLASPLLSVRLVQPWQTVLGNGRKGFLLSLLVDSNSSQ